MLINMDSKIELAKQEVTEKMKEVGMKCMDCNKDMSNDEFYCRRKISPDIYEIICLNCGTPKTKVN